ncbi:hypothetical protein ACWCQQ_47365 [Streptomyces sp. NPDC002143]
MTGFTEILDEPARVPEDSHVSWTNRAGSACRSVVKLGALEGGAIPATASKGSSPPSGTSEAVGRAGGLVLLLDPETTRPVVTAEAALISAVRTTACTVAGLRRLGPLAPRTLAVIGCGNLTLHHLDMLPGGCPRPCPSRWPPPLPKPSATRTSWCA